MENTKLGKNFLKLSIGTLGIVYGDIGTSPLYTIKECFNPAHGLLRSPENILGILSLIFWALVMVVIFKYISFILRADNQGEGGIMSLLSLIIPELTKSKLLFPVIVVGLVGTSLLLSEGMITPAITVLGAMEGLEVATPVLKPLIIPISIFIILGLFLVQKKGTERIANIFGPIMVIWFSVIGILGLLYILKAPQVLLAINPYYGFMFFVRNHLAGFLMLGSVVLAITGTEALYADIGHFGKSPVRFSFFTLVMPTLMLNYFGQGAAVLIAGDKAVENPFYYICPSWFLYPLIAIATIAAIVASQALISGAFSLIQQAIHLGYLPKLKIFHTSKDIKGQIYIPFINFSLMFACIGLVLAFKSSDKLASAYGIAVMGTMLCTTILFFILMIKIWHWNALKAIGIFLIFAFVDLSFFTANINKITTGGWFPLIIAIFVFTIMKTWKEGSGLVYKFISGTNISLEILTNDIKNQAYNIKRVSGNAIFMVGSTKSLGVLLHHIKHNKVLHDNVFLLSVISEKIPYVDFKSKLKITTHKEGFVELSARYGYMEQPDIYEILEICNNNGYKLNANQTSFYLGRVNIDVYGQSAMAQWRKKLFAFMHRNSESAVDYFRLPPGRVVELGTKITI